MSSQIKQRRLLDMTTSVASSGFSREILRNKWNYLINQKKHRKFVKAAYDILDLSQKYIEFYNHTKRYALKKWKLHYKWRLFSRKLTLNQKKQDITQHFETTVPFVWLSLTNKLIRSQKIIQYIFALQEKQQLDNATTLFLSWKEFVNESKQKHENLREKWVEMAKSLIKGSMVSEISQFQKKEDLRDLWSYFQSELLNRAVVDELTRQKLHLDSLRNWQFFYSQLKINKIESEYENYAYHQNLLATWQDIIAQYVEQTNRAIFTSERERLNSALRIFDLASLIVKKRDIDALKESKRKLDKMRDQKCLILSFRKWKIISTLSSLTNTTTRETFKDSLQTYFGKTAGYCARRIQRTFRRFNSKNKIKNEFLQGFFSSWYIFTFKDPKKMMQMPEFEMNLNTDIDNLINTNFSIEPPQCSFESVRTMVSFRKLMKEREHLRLLPFDYLSITDPEAKFMPIFFDVPRECYDKLTSAIPIEVGQIFAKSVQSFDITFQTKFDKIPDDEGYDLMDGFFQAISHSEFGETTSFLSDDNSQDHSILIPHKIEKDESSQIIEGSSKADDIFMFSPGSTDIIFESDQNILDVRNIDEFHTSSNVSQDESPIQAPAMLFVFYDFLSVVPGIVNSIVSNQINEIDKNISILDKLRNISNINEYSDEESLNNTNINEEEEKPKTDKIVEQENEKIKFDEIPKIDESEKIDEEENIGLDHKNITLDITLDTFLDNDALTIERRPNEQTSSSSDSEPFLFEKQLEKVVNTEPQTVDETGFFTMTLDDNHKDKFLFTIDESLLDQPKEQIDIEELELSLMTTLITVVNDAIFQPLNNLSIQGLNDEENDFSPLSTHTETIESEHHSEAVESRDITIQLPEQSPLPTPGAAKDDSTPPSKMTADVKEETFTTPMSVKNDSFGEFLGTPKISLEISQKSILDIPKEHSTNDEPKQTSSSSIGFISENETKQAISTQENETNHDNENETNQENEYETIHESETNNDRTNDYETIHEDVSTQEKSVEFDFLEKELQSVLSDAMSSTVKYSIPVVNYVLQPQNQNLNISAKDFNFDFNRVINDAIKSSINISVDMRFPSTQFNDKPVEQPQKMKKIIKVISSDSATMETENSKKSSDYYVSDFEVIELPKQFDIGLIEAMEDGIKQAISLSTNSFGSEAKQKTKEKAKKEKVDFSSLSLNFLENGFNSVIEDSANTVVEVSTNDLAHNMFNFEKKQFANVNSLLSKGFDEVLSDATKSVFLNSLTFSMQNTKI